MPDHKSMEQFLDSTHKMVGFPHQHSWYVFNRGLVLSHSSDSAMLEKDNSSAGLELGV